MNRGMGESEQRLLKILRFPDSPILRFIIYIFVRGKCYGRY